MIDKRISYRFGGHPGASHEGAGSGQTSGGFGGGHERGGRFDPKPAPAPAPKDERVPDFVKQIITPPETPKDRIDVGFQEILRKQKIAKDRREKQQNLDYGQFFDPTPVVEKKGFFDSGIGKTLKWGAMALVPGLLPTTLAKALTTYNQAKTLSHYAKKAGLTETDIMSGLTSNIKSDLFSGKTTPTDVKDDRFGQRDRQAQAIAPKKDVITESVQKFSPRQMDLVRQRYNQLRQVMQSGEYMGQRLNNNQLASLQNTSKQLEAFLVDPQKMMMMARGGIAGLHG